MTLTPSAPPGWHDDGSGRQRWWDGTSWTDQYRDAPRPKGGLAIAALAVGAAAFLVGWIPVFGMLVGAGAIVIAVLALKRGQSRPFAIAGAVLGGVAAITSLIVLSVAIASGPRTPVPVPPQAVEESSQPEPSSSVALLTVPDFVGMTLADARSLALEVGLVPTAASGQDDWIVAASDPATGEEVAENSGIEFELTEPVAAPQTFSGVGDFVQSFEVSDISIVTFVCPECSSNTVLKTNGAESLLVNEIGPYSGSHWINLYENSLTTLFEINADAAWTLTIGPLESAPSHPGSIAGAGDNAFIMTSNTSVAALTNDGGGNFAIWVYGDRSDLVVNQIGAYSGTVIFELPGLVQVNSDGNWSITPQS